MFDPDDGLLGQEPAAAACANNDKVGSGREGLQSRAAAASSSFGVGLLGMFGWMVVDGESEDG